MGTRDDIVDIDSLEKGLLVTRTPREIEDDEEKVIYAASFQEVEENFVKYQIAEWILYSLFLVLAWGIGLFMLLCIPVRRFILREDIRSRKLFLTPNAIVYKVTRPVPFPCFGVLQKEKHVLLRSVADVVIEQGYMQSLFGVYSLRIENVGVRRPPHDDVKIQGIANPNAFKKAVMMHLSNMRNEKASALEDMQHLMVSPSKLPKHDSNLSGEVLLLQKLQEVGIFVKRMQSLVEQQSQITESID